MPTIHFQHEDVRLEVPPGTSILDAALKAGVQIKTTCGGQASCRLCKVVVRSGSEALSPMGASEQSVLGNVFFLTRERLACQTRLFGDVAVELALEPCRPPQNTPFDRRSRGRRRDVRTRRSGWRGPEGKG